MEFDSRMTEETKAFIKQALEYGSTMTDIVTSRQVFDAMADEMNRNRKFDDLEEKEFFASSLYDDCKIPITAYIPKTVSPTSSIVVFYHGGGFNLGSRKAFRNSIAFLAHHSNRIWVSVEYRLAPEYKHPTQVHDCISATKWVLENKTKALKAAKEANIGVCGDSAGAHLAVSVALELRDCIAFQLLIYPWLDLTGTSESYRRYAKVDYLVSDEMMRKNVSDFVTDLSLVGTPSVSPLYNDNVNGLPRCFIVGAELDPLLDDSLRYQKKLQTADIKCDLYVINGVVHGFFNGLFYKNAYLEAAVEILRFLNRV